MSRIPGWFFASTGSDISRRRLSEGEQQDTEKERKGEEREQGMQTDSAWYLEAGARTRVLVPQRLYFLVFHSYCHVSVTPPDERPVCK